MPLPHHPLVLLAISPIALAHAAAGAQTTAALAAPAAASDAAGGDGKRLGDIIVTGEKRETRLQSAPLAITAIGGDLLQQRNLNQLNDLNGYVPGLTIAKSEGAERIITIRGIGYETAQNPNSQPGVAFHIDGVYIAHVIALNQDLLDVDRVEVLRGPQGTVFGETATGGAINVITKKPVIGEASGTAAISYGNYDYVKATTSVNIPVSDTIAVRGAVQYLSHDGYGYSVAVPGRSKYPLDDANNIGYRGAVIFKPNDTFTALLEAQGFGSDRSAALQKDISDTTPGARHVAQDFPGVFRMNTKMVYLTLTQELGRSAMLKSVSAYQYLNKHQTSDNDRLASPYYFDHITLWQDKSKTFTQELSLSSLNDNRLEWTVGAFYLRQHALQNILETTIPAAAATTLSDGTAVKFQTDSPYQHTSLAGYGNATLRLGAKLSLIAGARYNYDEITAQPYQYYAVVPPREATSREVTGRIGAEYRLTPENMVYLTGSRGYKPTGLSFNSGSLFVPTSFRKETVNAIEAGTKNEFLDRTLRINVAGYYYRYRNFQFTAEDPVPFAGGTDNIPKADIYGAEVEATALPFDGARVDATASYGHGRFKGHFLTIDAQTAAQVRASTYAAIGFPAAYYYDPRVIAAVTAAREDVDGKSVPKLPTWQAQVSPSYSWRVAGGRVTIRGDAIYRGKFNYRLFAIAALDRVPAYTLFNAYVAYTPDDKPWTISFSALNLADRNGVNSRFSDPYGSGTTSVEYVDPRQLFGTVSFRF